MTVLGLPMDTALKVVSAGQQATSQFLILDGMDLSHRFAALREASKQNEREGQLGKSIDLQQLVIQLQPTSREEWYRLIDLLDRAARYEEQVAACLRLISLDDSWWECDDAGAWAAPGDALVKLGRYAEALPVYEKASGAYRMECAPEIQAWGAEADYDDFPFQERIVTALIGMGNYTRALDICTYIAPPELDEATEDEWDYPIY